MKAFIESSLDTRCRTSGLKPEFVALALILVTLPACSSSCSQEASPPDRESTQSSDIGRQRSEVVERENLESYNDQNDAESSMPGVNVETNAQTTYNGAANENDASGAQDVQNADITDEDPNGLDLPTFTDLKFFGSNRTPTATDWSKLHNRAEELRANAARNASKGQYERAYGDALQGWQLIRENKSDPESRQLAEQLLEDLQEYAAELPTHDSSDGTPWSSRGSVLVNDD